MAAPLPIPDTQHRAAPDPYRPPDIDLTAQRSGSGLLAIPPLELATVPLATHGDDLLAAPASGVRLLVDTPRAIDSWSTLRVVALVALFAAILLPTRAGPPWALILHPTDVSFVAVATTIIIAALHFLTRDPVLRERVGAIAAILLVPFGIQALREAIARDQFDGQPMLAHLATSPALVASLLVGAIALLAGLASLPRAQSRLAPRIAIGVGLCLLLLPALVPGQTSIHAGVGMTGDSSTIPVMALFSTLGQTPFLGDRLAAFALLGSLMLGVLAVVLAVGPGRRHGFALGVAAWVALIMPLAILALFAARSDAWFDVFAPMKVVLFLAALVAFGASAVGVLLVQHSARTGRSAPRPGNSA